MSIGELKITADSTQAIQSTQALQAQFDRTISAMQQGMQKAGVAAENTGTKWTEMASKLSLVGTTARGIMGYLEGMEERVKAASKLNSQINRIAADDLSQLRDMTGDLVSPEQIIAMETLFRKYNITTEQTGNVLKGIIAIAREQGKDASDLAANITEGVISGSRDVLENYGIMVETMKDKDEQRLQILQQFKTQFGDMKMEAEGYAEQQEKFHNAKKIQDAQSLHAIEQQIVGYKQLKKTATSAFEWTATFVASGGKWPPQVALDKMRDTVEKLKAENESLTRVVAIEMSEGFERVLSAEKAGFATAQDRAWLEEDVRVKQQKANNERLKKLKEYEAAQLRLVKLAEDTNQLTDAHLEGLRAVQKQIREATKQAEQYKSTLEKMGYTPDFFAALAKARQGITESLAGQNEKAKEGKKLSDEELLNLKLKAIAQGKNVELTDKEIALMSQLAIKKGRIASEEDKAAKLNNEVQQKIDKRFDESFKKNQINYEVTGKFLYEKNRLERLYQEERAKGDKSDVFRLQAIESQMEKLKETTKWQKKAREDIAASESGLNYQERITNEKLLFDIGEAKFRRDLAFKEGNKEAYAIEQAKLTALQAQGEAQAKSVEWQRVFNAERADKESKLFYQQYINDSGILLQIERERLNIQIALKNTDPLSAANAQARLTALQQQGEAMGQFNLKMKEWEQSSYGAIGALRNVWQQSGDALLMTDEQLKKSGKTRSQAIKEALQAQILALGKQNLFEGGTQLAKGFAALATGLPTAPVFFKSAATHFAVAAAAGIGNRLFGGGGGSNKNESKNAPTTNLNTSNTSNRTINVIIPGGVIVNRDDMVRTVRSATADYDSRN